MSGYRYIAIDPTGARVSGVLSLASEQAVLSELETRKLTPLELSPVKERSAIRRRRMPVRALATSYAQLADLLRAGVPLLRGLRLLGARKSRPALAKVFNDLGDAVADGSELAEAMNNRPEVFSRVHVAMVRAGEKGGFLEQVLGRLGQLLTNQADLRAKVVGSLIYPAVLVFVGSVALLGIFTFIIPKFKQVYAKIHLNILSKSIIGLGDFFSSNILWLFGGLATAVILGVWASRDPELRRRFDRIRLHLPVLGPLFSTLAVARFCRVLGTMLDNSIPLIAALEIARDATGSSEMEEAVNKAIEAVRQGQSLAAPLGASGLFPDDVVEMISVGESANNLDAVLVTVAETLEARLERQLTGAVKLVEPLLICVIAVIVGLVAMGLIAPITQLASGIGR